MLKTEVVCTLRVGGFHNWPGAPDEVSFLRTQHRHVFWVTAKKRVNRNDREVEFITLKQWVAEYLTDQYSLIFGDHLDFGAMSCEMIAQDLLLALDLSFCSVYEDGENGAEVTAE